MWTGLQSLVLVHEWFASDRIHAYVEHETLDLIGPRSIANRQSEIRHAIRAYSPEGGRWTMLNGEISHGSDEELESDLRRAPFNFYRLVKAVAVGDPFYEVRLGPGDIPGTRRIEFHGPDGALGGWVIGFTPAKRARSRGGVRRSTPLFDQNTGGSSYSPNTSRSASHISPSVA